MNSIKLLLTLTLALTLTACGGGGSSSSSSFSSLVRYSELQPDVSIRNTSAITQQVTYTIDTTGNEDAISDIGDVTTAGSATVTEEYQDGTVNGESDETNDIHELSITSAEGTVVSYDHSSDNYEESFFGVQVMDNETDPANDSDDATYVILYSNPYDKGLDYNSYGIWFKLGTETATEYTYELGTVSSGVKTDAANMPTTGLANYRGDYIGHYYGPTSNSDSTEYVVEGTVSIGADFSLGTLIYQSAVSSAEDDVTGDAVTGDNLIALGNTLNISGTELTITGSSFTGDLATSNGLSGTITGQFYGPAAEEVGGIFELQEDVTAEERPVDTYTFIGAFGAAESIPE